MRAAIYLRLSRDSDTSTSIERQREACRAYALARGWTVVAEAEDVDVSGSKVAPADRAGFGALLARTDVDTILAYRIDRVARSVGDFAALLRDLEGRRIALVSATEPFDLTDPLGKALVYLVAIFAEMEADAIGTRVRSSIAKLRRTGRWSHGPPPYGYRSVPALDGVGRTLELVPEEADVLREIAARIVDGDPVRTIAADLNRRGVPAKRTATWDHRVIRTTIRGDHLLGRVKHKGALVRDELTGEPYAPFPPILDVSTLEQVRAALDPVPLDGDLRRPRRVLSGLCYCASCGRRLVVSSSRSSDGRKATYKCQTGKARGCPGAGVLADWLEPYVEERFLEAFGDRPIMRPTRAVAPVGLADLDAQIREVVGEVAEAPAEREAELLELLRRLKARRVELARPRLEPATEELGATLGDLWPDQPAHARRATMLSAGIRVELGPGKGGARALDVGRVSVTFPTT